MGTSENWVLLEFTETQAPRISGSLNTCFYWATKSYVHCLSWCCLPKTAAKEGRRLSPPSFYQEAPASEERLHNEDGNKIHNTFLAQMYFLWLPSWALAVVSPSKHPPIKCIFTKLFPWISKNLEIFSQESNSISPLSHLHATNTTEKVIAQWHGKLRDSWTAQVHWKQGMFPQHAICIRAEDKGIKWIYRLLNLIPEKVLRKHVMN